MRQENECTCIETLAMACIPKQTWCEPYDFETALFEGTIFPCLNLPFFKASKGQITDQHPSLSATPKQNEREKQMHELSTISFAINDLTLYLDTHPDCKEGLNVMKLLLKKRLQLLTDFATNYNPLTQISMVTGNPDCDCYGWIEGPMPWEGACI